MSKKTKFSEMKDNLVYLDDRSQEVKILRKNTKLILLTLITASVVFITVILHDLVLVFPKDNICLGNKFCKIDLVESIPENLTFPDGSPKFLDTYSAWKKLLKMASTSIDLTVFYWSLKNKDVSPMHMPSAWEGEDIFKELLHIGKGEKVKIRIAQNLPSKRFPQNDSRQLEQEGAAEVRSLNFDQLIGAGILHTKMWTVDGLHAYIGSANMDWQSLTQVKEVGVLIQDCPCLVKDIQKIFEVYWLLGGASEIPPLPKSLRTVFNLKNPMSLYLNNIFSDVFVSSSPLPFNPKGRTNDVDSIISIIRSAKRFVYIAVMDYFPRMLYSSDEFWPVIDEELRRAALNNKVEVRLLASHWNHTRADMPRWLRSLQDISGQSSPSVKVETKLFVVPAFTEEQKQLPFARVNHNKYMVTDITAYIGTSNWSGDYFTNTAGVSLSLSEKNTTDFLTKGASIRKQLESLFLRDWNSQYAMPVEKFL